MFWWAFPPFFRRYLTPRLVSPQFRNLYHYPATLISPKVILLLEAPPFPTSSFWPYLPQILSPTSLFFPNNLFPFFFQLVHHHSFLPWTPVFSSNALDSLPHLYLLTVLLPITLPVSPWPCHICQTNYIIFPKWGMDLWGYKSWSSIVQLPSGAAHYWGGEKRNGCSSPFLSIHPRGNSWNQRGC